MKNLTLALFVTLAAVLGACSSSVVVPDVPAPAQEFARNVDVSLSPEAPRETVLLVSRSDGSVVKQTIYSSADICFKKSSDSATTCLTQGAPVFDPDTNTIVGFEMVEEHINLIAKTD